MDSFNLMYHHPKPVVKATTTDHDFDFDDDLFDRVLGCPDKIDIPERYIPEDEPEVGPEEERRRAEKAEAICRLLSKSGVGAGGIVRLPLLLPPRRGPPAAQLPQQQPLQHQQHHSNYGYRNGTGSNLSTATTNTSGFGSGASSRLSGTLSVTSLPSSPQKRLKAPFRQGVDGSIRNSKRAPSVHSSACDWSLAGVNAPSTPYIYRDTNYSQKYSSTVPNHKSERNNGLVFSSSQRLGSQHPGHSPPPLSYSSLQSHQQRREQDSDYSSHFSPLRPSHSYHSSYSSTSSGSSDREDLLHLQQSIAREVTEKSRIVAVRALGSSPGPIGHSPTPRRSPYRPATPPSPVHLPTVQHRESFFT